MGPVTRSGLEKAESHHDFATIFRPRHTILEGLMGSFGGTAGHEVREKCLDRSPLVSYTDLCQFWPDSAGRIVTLPVPFLPSFSSHLQIMALMDSGVRSRF